MHTNFKGFFFQIVFILLGFFLLDCMTCLVKENVDAENIRAD